MAEASLEVGESSTPVSRRPITVTPTTASVTQQELPVRRTASKISVGAVLCTVRTPLGHPVRTL